jgi:hypothetical protein
MAASLHASHYRGNVMFILKLDPVNVTTPYSIHSELHRSRPLECNVYRSGCDLRGPAFQRYCAGDHSE